MASFDFQDFEKRELRRQHGIKIGQIHVRTYRVPADAVDTLILARGDTVTLRDVTSASALLAPRVLHNPRRQPPKGGFVKIEITFIQPEAYS